MSCNYFEYQKLHDSLYYGVALTDEQLNKAALTLRNYLINAGGGNVLKELGIGFRMEEKRSRMFPELNELVKFRFVFLEGENKGRELTVSEIRAIGMFLKHGPFENNLCSTKKNTNESIENENNNSEVKVKVDGGYIIAGPNMDPDYTGAYIAFETNDGDIVDIVTVESKKEENYKKSHVYCYEDVYTEDYTRKFVIQHEEIEKAISGE